MKSHLFINNPVTER